MVRRVFIEMLRRDIYGGQPSADANITVNLVNLWLNQGVAIAARKNWQDNAQFEGIAYTNGSFYTTYKNLAVTKDEQFLYKTALPQLPLGIGNDEGISSVVLTDSVQNSYPIIWVNKNQQSFMRGMRTPQNKLMGYSEGGSVFFMSTMPLTEFTAKATMISGGDSSNLDSTLNIPDDYLPIAQEYVYKRALAQKQMPIDAANDGLDGGKIE